MPLQHILQKCKTFKEVEMSGNIESALCRARWDPTKVNDVTYTGQLIPPQAPAQAAPIRITVLGSWWAALLLVCTTMMCLTSAFTAFILYVRPVLQVNPASLWDPTSAMSSQQASTAEKCAVGSESSVSMFFFESLTEHGAAEDRARRPGV